MLVNIRIYITCAIFLRLVKLSKTEILDAILIDRKFKAAFLGDFITVYWKKKGSIFEMSDYSGRMLFVFP